MMNREHHASLASPATEDQLLRSVLVNAVWFVGSGGFFVQARIEFGRRASFVYGLAYLVIFGIGLYNGYTGLRNVIHAFIRNQAAR